MNVFIVGGTGFIGYHSTLEFLENGHKVSSLSLDDIPLGDWYPKQVDVHYGDVFEMSEDDMTALFKGL